MEVIEARGYSRGLEEESCVMLVNLGSSDLPARRISNMYELSSMEICTASVQYEVGNLKLSQACRPLFKEVEEWVLEIGMHMLPRGDMLDEREGCCIHFLAMSFRKHVGSTT